MKAASTACRPMTMLNTDPPAPRFFSLTSSEPNRRVMTTRTAEMTAAPRTQSVPLR